MVFERIQSLSEREFALGGPMDIGPGMSEDIISADVRGIDESSEPKFLCICDKIKSSNGYGQKNT
jgi:hypothetical protein